MRVNMLAARHKAKIHKAQTTRFAGGRFAPTEQFQNKIALTKQRKLNGAEKIYSARKFLCIKRFFPAPFPSFKHDKNLFCSGTFILTKRNVGNQVPFCLGAWANNQFVAPRFWACLF